MASAWSGRCNTCGEWNTLEERIDVSSPGAFSSGQSLAMQTVASSLAKDHKRFVTHNSEVDTVLGGGIVPGIVNLLACLPGIC